MRERWNWSSASSYMPSTRSVMPATRWTFQSLAAVRRRCSTPWRAALFFAAGEEHVDAVEIGFDGARVEFKGVVEGFAGGHDVEVAAESVTDILELGDAEAGPGGGEGGVALGDGLEKLAGAVEVGAAAGALHESGEEGLGLEVFLRKLFAEAAWGARADGLCGSLLELA
jgi:hypothetical protein